MLRFFLLQLEGSVAAGRLEKQRVRMCMQRFCGDEMVGETEGENVYEKVL